MFGAEQDQERSTEEEEESPLQRQVENLLALLVSCLGWK